MNLLFTLLCFSHFYGLHWAETNIYPPKKVSKVVIDAGHGGKDSGAKGKLYREKDITLSVALKLGQYIEQNLPDVKVIYTRKTDVFIPLFERAEIANKNQADLFISIHCNSVPGKKTYIKGTETFVMGLHTAEENLEVAKRENEVVLLEDNYKTKYGGFDPNAPESHIILSMFQNVFIDRSILFAEKIESQFKNKANRASRGVKQAGFVVLKATSMPSVLVELGFLSNPEEEIYMKSEEGQNILASAIYRAFKEYKLQIESNK
jgi:N-acetylmuramoyl-L-alanine amidase